LANKTFPPKFSQDILYPAIYNLDKLPMPTGMVNDGVPGDINLGSYFNVSFENLSGINSNPSLSYGKHIFKITLISDPGYSSGLNLPRLKAGSKILFEFKDADGTIIFSDTTPIHSTSDFSGYVWIKEDPLRTYSSIVQGTGKMTIVGIVKTDSGNWRKKYNVRSELSIDINLYNNDLDVEPNNSPIIFQKDTGSMGSATVITEQLVPHAGADIQQSTVEISASQMKTYSGEVSNILIEFKSSGSADQENTEWTGLGSHPLVSSSYEDSIDEKYSAGINPLSEKFIFPIMSSQIPYDGGSDKNKVKFRLRFMNKAGSFAKDISSPTGEFQIEYPSGSNDWLEFIGSSVILAGSTIYGNSDNLVVESSLGQYSFFYEGHAVPKNSTTGQTFGSNGKVISSPQYGQSPYSSGDSTE
jgi:hypothetical protein